MRFIPNVVRIELPEDASPTDAQRRDVAMKLVNSSALSAHMNQQVIDSLVYGTGYTTITWDGGDE